MRAIVVGQLRKNCTVQDDAGRGFRASIFVAGNVTKGTWKGVVFAIAGGRRGLKPLTIPGRD
jgi:hypothetical protein